MPSYLAKLIKLLPTNNHVLRLNPLRKTEYISTSLLLLSKDTNPELGVLDNATTGIRKVFQKSDPEEPKNPPHRRPIIHLNNPDPYDPQATQSVQDNNQIVASEHLQVRIHPGHVFT